MTGDSCYISQFVVNCRCQIDGGMQMFRMQLRLKLGGLKNE